MKKSIILFLLICAGCATSYSERGFNGYGYSEIRTNPDSFIVTFKGNGLTHSTDVTKYVLLRASELSLQNGYKYFVILSSEDCTSKSNYTNTKTNVSASENLTSKRHGISKNDAAQATTTTTSGTVIRPGTNIRIKCFEEKPPMDDAIDAVFYWNANNPNN